MPLLSDYFFRPRTNSCGITLLRTLCLLVLFSLSALVVSHTVKDPETNWGRLS
jgi:hypothetical protein